MIYTLGSELQETDMETVLLSQIPALFLISEAQCIPVLRQLGINVEMDTPLSEICFCKVESQQECLYGTLAVPKLLDVLGSRYRMAYVITEKYLVLVDNDGFAERLVNRIRRKKVHQGETKERFFYNFIAEFMSRDTVLLENFEKELMEMEDETARGKAEDFQHRIQPIRKQLLTLRGYYDQIADMGKDLEENDNRYFAKKQLKYFGTISDRAERLKDRTGHLLEYAQQVRDAYQAVIDAKQNENMQFLTIISTIFFPLTLITGWYGMNFQNMPELENGYPFIILVSILVVVGCIFIFKKKKIL